MLSDVTAFFSPPTLPRYNSYVPTVLCMGEIIFFWYVQYPGLGLDLLDKKSRISPFLQQQQPFGKDS